MNKISLILLISILSLSIESNAQLTAQAGADTVACSPTTYPYLGGSPTAFGGTPPYSYEWVYDADILNTFLYLDNPYIAHPRVRAVPLTGDTLVFTIRVTDNTGSTVSDFVRVYVARWTCSSTPCVKNKSATDTIILNNGCYGNYSPNTIRWSPATKLSDTTIASPVTWTNVSTQYVAKLTNAIGCWRLDTCKVNVVPTAVAGLDKLKGYVALHPHPVNETSELTVSNDMLGGELKVYAIDGKLILKQSITSSNTIIGDKLGVSAFYIYSYEKQGSKPVYGKWVSE
jgi:hypothetical protein